MTIPNKVSIVILNYNAGNLLEKCVESITQSNYSNYEIILVDNASSDESHHNAKSKFPEVVLLENKENLGYCEGNNVGVRKATGEFLVILNPDTRVSPNWLDALIQEFSNLGEGLYQPKILSEDNVDTINTCGNSIQVFGFGFSRGKGDKDSGQFENLEEINYASGACLFTTKKIFEKIGFFDSFLFAYHDDLDLGWRASLLGIKSFYVPNSIIFHAESYNFKWSNFKYYLLERNRLYCILTHYKKSNFYKMIPCLTIIEIYMILFYASKGMFRQKIKIYFELFRKRKIIKEKYLQLQDSRIISDSQIIDKFSNTIFVPDVVTSKFFSKNFNNMLDFLTKIVRSFIK